MHLKQLITPQPIVETHPPVNVPSVSQEEEEAVIGDVISLEGRSRLKRELAILKASNPALYDKIVSMR